MRRSAWVALISIPFVGCTTAPGGNADTADTGGEPGSTSTAHPGSTGTPEPGATTGAAATSTGGDTTASPESSGGADGPKYDVHGVVEHGPCENADAGIYCQDGEAITCDGNGNVSAIDVCKPDICLAGQGCVVCTEGQFHCSGPRVMQCDTAVNPPRWQEIEVCNPTAGQGCNGGTGTCEVLEPIGGVAPTGNYYQYADFHGFDGFSGGYDVDCFEDFIYVSGASFANDVDVYQVTIEDSDGDGDIEPNQHPDNPDETGPIETRTLTKIMTIPGVTVFSSSSEIYALEDRIYVGGGNITEYIFGSGNSVVTAPPSWIGTFAQIGYDDVNGVWYASNEGDRRVFQYDEETAAWGLAFRFPPLAGDHLDGMEVVTDPNTGIPYVYVSDMTSDFIGQYRLDPDEGWVQQNLFAYAGTAGSLVEGMGFGTFNHFWATGGDSLYEVGGGDLQDYTEPEPEG